MRVPLVDPDRDPQVRALATRVRGARWGRISALYGTLLHSPSVAEGWLALGTAVRRRTHLDDRTRELAICLVARVCDQSYEWASHADLARTAGATDPELDALLDRDACPTFAPRERLVLDLVEATARDAVVDELLAAASAELDTAQLVEVVATAAYYVGTARYLSALGIHAGAPSVPGPAPESTP